jgi:hypothetical protein
MALTFHDLIGGKGEIDKIHAVSVFCRFVAFRV